MLFQSLSALRGKLVSVGVSVTFAGDDRLTVIVNPTLKPEVAQKSPELANPFVLTATAAELDEGFAAEFDKYSVKVTDLSTQAANQIAAMEAQSKVLAEKVRAKASTMTSVPGTKTTNAKAELADLMNLGTTIDLGDDDESTDATPAEVGGVMSAADLF
jgi:PRTRC genetic system protein E